jgi:hypothetical protein
LQREFPVNLLAGLGAWVMENAVKVVNLWHKAN